jgi:hypothetical protein
MSGKPEARRVRRNRGDDFLCWFFCKRKKPGKDMQILIHKYNQARLRVSLNMEIAMAAIDDLNASITALESAATAIVAKAGSQDQTPAIEAAKARVDVVTANLNAASAPTQ